jgi:hypothetical protein
MFTSIVLTTCHMCNVNGWHVCYGTRHFVLWHLPLRFTWSLSPKSQHK